MLAWLALFAIFRSVERRGYFGRTYWHSVGIIDHILRGASLRVTVRST